MLSFQLINAGIALPLLVIPALGQLPSSCIRSLTPTNSIQPSIASGYQLGLVATGISNPRSIEFDSSGNLLVVQSGHGIASLQLEDNGGVCVGVKSKKDIIEASTVSNRLRLSDKPDQLLIYLRKAQSWPSSFSRWEDAVCFLSGSCLFLAV